MAASDDGLLARWSRRKAQGREGALRDETVVVPTVPAPGPASPGDGPLSGAAPPPIDAYPAIVAELVARSEASIASLSLR